MSEGTSTSTSPRAPWIPKFLKALKISGVASTAAAEAGVSVAAAYLHRRQDPSIAAEWDAAAEHAMRSIPSQLMRVEEVCRELGCSYSTVKRLAKALGEIIERKPGVRLDGVRGMIRYVSKAFVARAKARRERALPAESLPLKEASAIAGRTERALTDAIERGKLPAEWAAFNVPVKRKAGKAHRRAMEGHVIQRDALETYRNQRREAKGDGPAALTKEPPLEIDGVVYLTRARATQIKGIRAWMLSHYFGTPGESKEKEKCPHLKGRVGRARLIDWPQARLTRLGFAKADLEEIANALRGLGKWPAKIAEPIRDGQGTWYFAHQARDRFAPDTEYTAYHHRLARYRESCWLLDGRRRCNDSATTPRPITFKMVAPPAGTLTRSAIPVYHEADLIEIRKREQDPSLRGTVFPPPESCRIATRAAEASPAVAGTEYPGHVRKVRKTGRHSENDALYKFCYDLYYAMNQTRSQVFEKLTKAFPDDIPAVDPDNPDLRFIGTYAQRWADGFSPPLRREKGGAQK